MNAHDGNHRGVGFGIILADAEGSHYFIREEVLQQSRVTRQVAQKLLGGRPVTDLKYGVLKCPTLTPLTTDVAEGTYMCPW